MDVFTFDESYVRRLREGDPQTEQHFVAYFDQLLRIKLRARLESAETAEDIRHETFIRVIKALRAGSVRQPERFAAFVNSICNNVLLEYYRASGSRQSVNERHVEIPDSVLDLEGLLVTKEAAERVRKILDEMPEQDRQLLRAIFLEEKEKEKVCQEFGIDRDYLRVLVQRAKDRFKSLYERDTHRLSQELENKWS